MRVLIFMCVIVLQVLLC